MGPASPAGCPICRGATDPRERLLTTLCATHLAEASPLTVEEIDAALGEGYGAYLTELAARLGMSVAELVRYRIAA